MINGHAWRRAVLRAYACLSDTARLVGVMLSEYRGAEGLCYPSAKTLARDLGRAERSVRRAFVELVSNGFLAIVPRPGRSNLFALALPASQHETPDTGVRGEDLDPCHGSQPPPDTGVSPPLTRESAKRESNSISNGSRPPAAGPSPQDRAPDKPPNGFERRQPQGLAKGRFIPRDSAEWPLVEAQARERARKDGRAFNGAPVVEDKTTGRPIMGYYLFPDRS
jgi:Helix-turn-helix domain